MEGTTGLQAGSARRRWPWAAAAAIIGVALATAPGFPPEQRLWPLLTIPAISLVAGVGALLLVRRPGNPIGARTIDRRFDRGRYDGGRLLTAFGERLRDEVDLTTIRADVLATFDAAVRPARVGLWLRHGPEAGA